MGRNDDLIRLALLFALGIHCLFLLVAWKFYQLPLEFVEPPFEISVEFEEPEPVPEEVEEIIEEPEPVPEEVEEIIEEPEPVPEEPEEIIEEPEPVPEEVEEIIEEPEPVPEEPEEIIEEPEPISEEPEEVVEEPVPEWLEELIEEPEPVPEEVEEVIAGSGFVSEVMEDLIAEPEFLPEGPEGFVAKTDFISKEKVSDKKSKTELEGQGKPSGETVSNVENDGSSSQEQNQIKKPQFPQSYLQIVIKKIISAKRYPRFARDRGIEGKVLVEFTILGSGELQEVKVSDSSGYSILDQESVETLRRAAPFPPIPGKEDTDFVTMRIIIAFELES